MSIAVAKAELRSALRERRRRLVEDPAQGDHLFVGTLQIAEHVAAAFGAARTIAAYIGNGQEVDTLPILLQAIAGGRDTALPRLSDRGAALSFHHWCPGDTLLPGPFGILQPPPEAPLATPDLVVTPLLGFDRALHRLGQGGGSYDRTFATLPNARRIGVAWSVQEVEAVPTEPWDARLHAVATEREWIIAA